ncbi:hypothetical protein PCL_00947 [Purpureocillium lilacinum]|uniref:Uncharacterized protein n=1 Tax=Purpureocillium lilacinum TaxID=33203 RepID=A0A2U3E466_PURLI|nr:hypothetical protein PCL_00947 [Purpureocillium lilacinum]
MLGHRTRDAHQGRRDKPARKRTSPQSMTMMRRQRDYERCIAQQRARGRPLNGRWRCGDAWCMLPACRRDDAPTRAVRDRDRSRDGLWVDDLGASRQRAVEALAASPEVRLAFVRFKELCRPGRLEPSRGQLRELLASLLPRLHDEYKREGASSASSTVYENGDWASDRHAGARGGDEDPGLRGAAMHFLLQVEAWPRSQQQRRLRDWSFGGRSAEGLAAVLLQLWALDDEACLETEEAVDEQRWTELWGEWLQQHPPLPEAEAEGEAAAGPAGRDVVVVVVLEDDGLDAADEQRRRLLRRGDEGHRGRPCGNALGTDQGVGCGRGRSVSRHTSPVMPLSCHQLGRVQVSSLPQTRKLSDELGWAVLRGAVLVADLVPSPSVLELLGHPLIAECKVGTYSYVSGAGAQHHCMTALCHFANKEFILLHTLSLHAPPPSFLLTHRPIAVATRPDFCRPEANAHRRANRGGSPPVSRQYHYHRARSSPLARGPPSVPPRPVANHADTTLSPPDLPPTCAVAITMYRAPRSFSTSARVHPSFLPHLRHSRHMPFRWLKPILAVSIVGLAVKTYADVAGRRRDARLLAAERDAAEQQRRNNALMDVYGDRSSLEALEKAVEFYEKRR